METFGFSINDLSLIRMMPCATVGDGMIMPSGLQMKKGQSRVLTNDFEENVLICWNLIQGSSINDEFWEIISSDNNMTRPEEQTAPNAPYYSNAPHEPSGNQTLMKRLFKFMRSI